ncbi:MAG: hydroxyethylthiazole kinase [Acidimicrobiales bacterium]
MTVGESLQRVREQRPLIHQITNYVVMNESANATLALGALPVMAHALEEVAEIAQSSNALVLNLGTLSAQWIEAMLIAGHTANQCDIPVVLDPVGAGASRLRTETAKRLLSEIKIAVLSCNAGECASLTGIEASMRGVESLGTNVNAIDIARDAARAFGVVASVSGPIDHVSDGERGTAIANGHPMLTTITGTGCISSAVTACFLAVSEDPFDAAVAARIAVGVAGEDAAVTASGPGTFHVNLYDALAALDPHTIGRRALLS